MKVKPRRLEVKLRRTRKLRLKKFKKPRPLPTLDYDALRDIEIDETKLTSDLCRESFYDFVKEFWDVIIPEKPVWNWHIRYICDLAQKVAENLFLGNDKLHDLLVNIPPGTSKSTVLSVMFPAWVWTRMPTARFICVSFRYTLALRLSRKCRDVIKSEKYKTLFPEVEIRGDQDAKHHFANTAGGERYSAGSGGDVIGNHSHFLIVDDPIDPLNVASEAELETVNVWIEETLSGRKVDKELSVMIMVMQRLHQNDPSSRMLSSGGVKHVCLPAVLRWQGRDIEVKPSRLAKFYKDGMLDPVRLKLKTLVALSKKPRGDYLVSGQYLQNPVPPSGGLFKTDNLVLLDYNDEMTFLDPVRGRRNLLSVVRFWDKAITEGGGAYTVGVKMGLTRSNRLVVMDVKRFQYDSWKREREIKRTAKEDGKSVIVGIEQEPGSGGKESLQATTRRLIGYKVKPYKPTTSKTGEGRADAFSMQVNAGNVLVCRGTWRKAYLDELKHFPYSTYKDQVDASSGAYSVLAVNRRVVGGLRSKADSSHSVTKVKSKKSVTKELASRMTQEFRGRRTGKLFVI